jgi:hypothetical protein
VSESSAPWAEMRMPASKRELGWRGGEGETAAGELHSGGPKGPDDPGLVLDLRYASTQPRLRADRPRGSILVQLRRLLAFALTPLITRCDSS